MQFEALEHMPLVSVLFLDALYLFWLPITVAVLLLRYCPKKAVLNLAPIFLNTVFLLLGPVCWTRYGLCQYCTFPLWFSLPFILKVDTSSQDKDISAC